MISESSLRTNAESSTINTLMAMRSPLSTERAHITRRRNRGQPSVQLPFTTDDLVRLLLRLQSLNQRDAAPRVVAHPPRPRAARVFCADRQMLSRKVVVNEVDILETNIAHA